MKIPSKISRYLFEYRLLIFVFNALKCYSLFSVVDAIANDSKKSFTKLVSLTNGISNILFDDVISSHDKHSQKTKTFI